jgi:TRAP-type uncharacterized transport system fused permease subunit
VALAAYAGAAIAGAHPNRVGFTAMKLGAAAFIAPYMFVFNPPMLLLGEVSQIIQAIITSLIGTFALACGMQGWLLGRPASMVFRVPLVVAAITLIHPNLVTDLIGIGLFAATILLHRWFARKVSPVSVTPSAG